MAKSEEIETHCKKDENIYFSCRTGKKIISFCESKINSQSKYLEYRFGSPGKVEFIFKGSSDNKFNRAHILWSGNAANAIWFENYGFVYVVTDPMRGDVTLDVIKNKQKIGKFVCEKDYYGDF
ncbi:hypothetical protein RGU70_11145 [Herbaspirillum sp. RTI4]|uniref:hypothetical protein n=1 Tax=Herbaspirillum sp. RTI4 TaxID=3048640 RepID=UPI002AB3CA60|nr:hypothetical protein [Herbaspirillum sp. RTI4]MDY7578875.1 hypothetical protein [Herbaspirillum sp. RTI4]